MLGDLSIGGMPCVYDDLQMMPPGDDTARYSYEEIADIVPDSSS